MPAARALSHRCRPQSYAKAGSFMTPDPLLLKETRTWFNHAQEDLSAARLLNSGRAYRAALFHCQQAAEKAMKGFLTFHQKAFQKTHDLGELKPPCLTLDPSLASTLEKADDLSKYAWQFRYPGAPYEPDEVEATEVLARAEIIVREIQDRLPLSN